MNRPVRRGHYDGNGVERCDWPWFSEHGAHHGHGAGGHAVGGVATLQ